MAKVLIVDDDRILLKMYRTKFLKRKFEVDTALNGNSALAKIYKDKPDIILLDIMMPKMDGYELLKKIKEDDDLKSLPVVFMTNLSSTEENIEKGLSLGAVTYLTKHDYTPTEVVDKVDEITQAVQHLAGEPIPKTKVLIKDLHGD